MCMDFYWYLSVYYNHYLHLGVLPYLIQASIVLDEGVASVILQLLQCALCGTKALSGGTASTSPSKASKRDKDKERERDKDKDKDKEGLQEAITICLGELWIFVEHFI